MHLPSVLWYYQGKYKYLRLPMGLCISPDIFQEVMSELMFDWYHITLCDPGINRTEETIAQHLFWPKRRDQIATYVQTCPSCQRNKRKVKKYGWLPPKEAETSPWDKRCIDLIEPYTIRRKGKNEHIGKNVSQ
jgi:Integrase zinc binding domain